MLLQRVSEASESLPDKQQQPPPATCLCGHPVLDVPQEGHLLVAMPQVPIHTGSMMSA